MMAQSREFVRENMRLAVLGLRICSVHGGEPLPLDEYHFQRKPDGTYTQRCNDCKRRQGRAGNGYGEGVPTLERRLAAQACIAPLEALLDTFPANEYSGSVRARLLDVLELAQFHADVPVTVRGGREAGE